jgi:hypothetical protein
MAAIAASMTALAVWMALHNRQRSIALQAISSLGLGSSAVFASLIGTGEIASWVWPLWALLGLHSVPAILSVHWRLRLRQGHGIPQLAPAITALPLVLAAFLWFSGTPRIAVPVALSALLNSWETLRLRSAAAREEPLVRVGVRALTASLLHTAVTVAALW